MGSGALGWSAEDIASRGQIPQCGHPPSWAIQQAIKGAPVFVLHHEGAAFQQVLLGLSQGGTDDILRQRGGVRRLGRLLQEAFLGRRNPKVKVGGSGWHTVKETAVLLLSTQTARAAGRVCCAGDVGLPVSTVGRDDSLRPALPLALRSRTLTHRIAVGWQWLAGLHVSFGSDDDSKSDSRGPADRERRMRNPSS